MGIFDSLFDKRDKMDYCKACDYIFNLALIQNVQYTSEYSDIDELNYRAEIIGIVAAHLDTKPREKCTCSVSTFGKDIMYYGTVHGTALIATHPIQANLKTVFLPTCKQRHSHYTLFVRENMSNSINPTTSRILANEMLRLNGVSIDSARTNAVAMDINSVICFVDKILATYKFV